MADYQKMYHSLFNDVTDVISKLQLAQQKTEEMYMNSQETVITPLRGGDEKQSSGPPKTEPPTPKKKPPSHER